MRRCLVAILGGALAASLTACASGQATLPTARSSSQLVSYKRSGGLTGATVRLSLSRGGHVTASPDGDDFRLSHKQLARLKQDIRRADLADLPADNRPAQPVPDGYQSTVTAQGHTVHAEDGAIPDRLQPLLSRLNGLLRRAGIR